MYELVQNLLTFFMIISPIFSIISLIIAEMLGVSPMSFVFRSIKPENLHSLLDLKVVLFSLKNNQYIKVDSSYYASTNPQWEQFTDIHEELLYLYSIQR